MKADESVLDFPKDGLCPDVWEKVMSADGAYETWRLIPEVRDRLLSIAQAVCDEAKLDYSQMRVYITGSITSNTYTSNADIDLHLHLTYKIREFAEMTQNRVKNAFSRIKEQHTSDGAAIAGHPIEVYYQPNEFQDLMSVGCYDVKSDAWIVGPEVKDTGYNPYSELYQQIQAKANSLLKGIRDKVLDVYEKAVVLAKVASNNDDAELAAKLFNELYDSMASAVSLYQSARQMRKVYSSPESAEQAMKFRSSKKWKIADAAFKLMDKFGYLAILKQYTELYELINSTGSGLVDEVASSVLKTVKKYINNPEKLADSEGLAESTRAASLKLRPLVEKWMPEFDDKPTNQWGERWEELNANDWLLVTITTAAEDCQIDLYDDGPKVDKLKVSSVHMYQNGNLIVTLFGGANGGGEQGKCSFKTYLALVRKMVEKLVGISKPFEDAWLVDWDNDCCDDVWTLRFVLQPSDKTLSGMRKSGYSIMQVRESISSDVNVQYAQKLKAALGHKSCYTPKRDYSAAAAVAEACALKLPTDYAALCTEGNAALLLVLSGREETVKAGKLLGDSIINGKSSNVVLKHIDEALAWLQALDQTNELLKTEKHSRAFKTKLTAVQIAEGAKETLSLAALVAMLAIKGVLPAATLQKELKSVPASEIKADSKQFKDAIAKATQGKSCNGMNLTNVINCVARTIYAEAAGEGAKGQEAVASVIWNRAGGKRDNLIDVVLKPKQFSCWNKKTPGRTDSTYTLSIPAAARLPGKSRAAWENCVYLATKLADEEFTSTIGNRNSYMNKSTASQKAKDSWGSKLDLTVGKHSFGYLASNDGFKDQEAPSYIIKKGDTLSAIAKAHNTTVDALQKKNSIKDPNKIKIGQKILV